MVYSLCAILCISTCILACMLAHAWRLLKEHDKDMSIAERKYQGKCAHCYSRHISSCRPFGYNIERGSWTDRSTFDIYIPNPEALPVLSSDDLIKEDARLQKDIFTANKALHPFDPEHHIGQLNPYTKCPIRSEADYNEYLRFLSHDTVSHLRDPFALL